MVVLILILYIIVLLLILYIIALILILYIIVLLLILYIISLILILYIIVLILILYIIVLILILCIIVMIVNTLYYIFHNMDVLKVLMADWAKDNVYLLVLVEIDISLIPEGRYLKWGYRRCL